MLSNNISQESFCQSVPLRRLVFPNSDPREIFISLFVLAALNG